MLDDLCQTYQFIESQAEELIELAYILYESLKDSLVLVDLFKLLGKWRTLSFVHLLTYMEKTFKENNLQGFTTTANLLRSLT